MKQLFILASLLFLVTPCEATSPLDSLRPPLTVAVQLHGGRLVKIHGEFPQTNYSSITEASFLWQTTGRQKWQSAAGYPSAGFSVMHAQFGNQDILGQAIGCIPFMRYQLAAKKSLFTLRAGLGIAWFNKPYDASENPKNLVIGSAVANMSQLALEWQYAFSPTMALRTGASFTHCSGAHFTVPNIGANLPAFTVGIAYTPHNVFKKPNSENASISNKGIYSFGFHLAGGYHEFPGTVRPLDGPRYGAYGVNLHLTRRSSDHGKVLCGLHAYYFTAYRSYLRSQELLPDKEDDAIYASSLILYAGYEWNFGRLGFFLEAGYTLFNPTLDALNNVWDLPKHGWLYQHTAHKIGYRYYLQQQGIDSRPACMPYVQLALKTNGGTADFAELAIGFDFHSKQQRMNSRNK